MKNKKNYKKIIILTAVLLALLLSFSIFSNAHGFLENIKARFGRLNVQYNGRDITKEAEGFIRVDNDRAYIPLRGVANALGINVEWDPVTWTAILTDSDSSSSVLEYKVMMQEIEIERLNEEIKYLRLNSGSEDTSSNISLRKLEDELIRNYGTFERLDFDIYLKGDSRDIDIQIETDLNRGRDRDRWDDLRDRDIERFIEDIVHDVQREYRNANVYGYIRDIDDRRDLWTFDKASNGRIYFDERDRGSRSLSSIERTLDDDYYDYFSRIRLDFELKWRGDDIEFNIYTNESKNYSHWESISDRRIENLMKDVRSDIEREFKRTTARGRIWSDDNSELAQLNGYSFYRENY